MLFSVEITGVKVGGANSGEDLSDNNDPMGNAEY